MFGRSYDIAFGRVHYHYAELAGCINIDVVKPYSGAAYHLQVLGIFQNFGAYLGPAPNNQRVKILYDLPELFGGELCVYRYFEAGNFGELFDPGFGKAVADKNLHQFLLKHISPNSPHRGLFTDKPLIYEKIPEHNPPSPLIQNKANIIDPLTPKIKIRKEVLSQPGSLRSAASPANHLTLPTVCSLAPAFCNSSSIMFLKVFSAGPPANTTPLIINEGVLSTPARVASRTFFSTRGLYLESSRHWLNFSCDIPSWTAILTRLAGERSGAVNSIS